MKEIVLKTGQITSVSDEDFDYLFNFEWSLYGNYVVRRDTIGNFIHIHRVIADRMGLTYIIIDHKDQDPLNNQRNNLRAANYSQNGANKRKSSKGNITSDFKGVSWDSHTQKWRAFIKRDGMKKALGYFDSEIESAKLITKLP